MKQRTFTVRRRSDGDWAIFRRDYLPEECRKVNAVVPVGLGYPVRVNYPRRSDARKAASRLENNKPT